MTLPNALWYAGQRRSASADARRHHPPAAPSRTEGAPRRAEPNARQAGSSSPDGAPPGLPEYTQYLLDVSAAIMIAVPCCDDENPALRVSERSALRSRIRAMTHAMQADVSYTVLIVALLYALRYRQGLAQTPGPIGRSSRRRTAYAAAPFSRDLVLLGALVLASKYVNDHPQSNAHWAAVLGVSADVMNLVERTVLVGMRYRMHVAPAGFSAWVSFLFDTPRLQAYLCAT